VDAVQLVSDGGFVTSGDVRHRVVLGHAADQDRCTCPWWGKFRGAKGPCKGPASMSSPSASQRRAPPNIDKR
jgi:hypothetical protein